MAPTFHDFEEVFLVGETEQHIRNFFFFIALMLCVSLTPTPGSRTALAVKHEKLKRLRGNFPKQRHDSSDDYKFPPDP